MVKAKFVVDNREAGETEDCGLICSDRFGRDERREPVSVSRSRR